MYNAAELIGFFTWNRRVSVVWRSFHPRCFTQKLRSAIFMLIREPDLP